MQQQVELQEELVRATRWRGALKLDTQDAQAYSAHCKTLDRTLQNKISKDLTRARVWRNTRSTVTVGVRGRRARSPPLAAAPPEVEAALSRVMCVFVARSGCTYHLDLLYIAGALYEVLGTEWETCTALLRLQASDGTIFEMGRVRASAAEFCTALRHLYPDLYNVFDTEDVAMERWVVSWLRTLLARQMPRDAVLSLWEHYICPTPALLYLHPYVCLALVGSISSELQDCEDSEALQHYLERPHIVARDTERIIAHAIKLRAALKEAGVI